MFILPLYGGPHRSYRKALHTLLHGSQTAGTVMCELVAPPPRQTRGATRWDYPTWPLGETRSGITRWGRPLGYLM